MRPQVHIATIATLALFSATTSADVICKKCEYVINAPASYAGSYWPGDRGTLLNASTLGADQWWVLDLNDVSDATVTVAWLNGKLPAPPSWALELYADAGTICFVKTCTFPAIDFFNPLISGELPISVRRATMRSPLVPGRYVVRIAAQARETGTGYTGKLMFSR